MGRASQEPHLKTRPLEIGDVSSSEQLMPNRSGQPENCTQKKTWEQDGAQLLLFLPGGVMVMEPDTGRTAYLH